MEFQVDRDVNALYIKLRAGHVARTIELTDSLSVDMDADDTPLGLAFINAGEFVPFLRDHDNDAYSPPRLREIFRVTAA
jgi:uncharacterized protein YuzE